MPQPTPRLHLGWRERTQDLERSSREPGGIPNGAQRRGAPGARRRQEGQPLDQPGQLDRGVHLGGST
eukprot:4588594-Prymnesium_polylepis.1